MNDTSAILMELTGIELSSSAVIEQILACKCSALRSCRIPVS